MQNSITSNTIALPNTHSLYTNTSYIIYAVVYFHEPHAVHEWAERVPLGGDPAGAANPSLRSETLG